MLNKELKDKLERMVKLRKVIDTKVKAIYEEYRILGCECSDAIIQKKGGEIVGYLKTPLQIKLGGTVYELKPNYIKDGQLSTMWKPCGIQAFEISEISNEPLHVESK